MWDESERQNKWLSNQNPTRIEAVRISDFFRISSFGFRIYFRLTPVPPKTAKNLHRAPLLKPDVNENRVAR